MSTRSHFSDADSFQYQSDQFSEWLTQQPGVTVSPKIWISDLRSHGSGRGVVANTDIEEGEELFCIPRDILLTVQNSRLNKHIPQELAELGPWLSLILVMIHEYLLGDQSPWKQYFQVLPTSFDTLMFWTDEELSHLQASAIVDKIGKQEADQSILETVLPIVYSNPHLFPPASGVASYNDNAGAHSLLKLAHRMGSLIMAYAFDIEKGEDEEGDGQDGYLTDDEEQLPKGMVPLADLLNANADRNNARLFQEEKSLVMRTIKPVKAGDELFNDYGEIPRADLLRRYGYITDNYAQYDVVELPLTLICDAAGFEDVESKPYPQLEFLENFEILEDGFCIPRPLPDESSLLDILPDELLILVKVLTLSAEELQQRQSKNKPPKPALDNQEAQILLDAVRAKLSQYATTLEQDYQILRDLPSTSLESSACRHKMAVKVRAGEKEILKQLSSMLADFVSSGSNKRSAEDSLHGLQKKGKN
ncbi:SET domain protein [Talaromyces proteolyticus]|uniref:Ribosomal lysine N-methyltransferase 4 n=1 Tax=Talaromyces proteolyticus TaxID=1131652 RepID=A0AAD4KE10_9EURO|nr:SET domain protein [Talaromyces proteolyticus]KAH8689632.1 SET domain protein [Talaromyces proteolyticus]